MNIIAILNKVSLEKSEVRIDMTRGAFCGVVCFDEELQAFYIKDSLSKIYINVDQVVTIIVY